MKRGREIDKWYPFYIDKWLFGSTRHELVIRPGWPERWPNLAPLVPPEILAQSFTDLRGIFADLMTLSKKDDGYIRANETTPYPLEQLAGMFFVPLEHLKATIAICLHPDVAKIEEQGPGIYYIKTTDIYRLSNRRMKDIQESELPPEEGNPSLFVKCPKRFKSMATAMGLVRFSRLIAAVAIGRALNPGEEVHHRNRKEADDRPENLMLFATHKDHIRHQHGNPVKAIWDGSGLPPDVITALSAEISALILEENKEDEIKSSREDLSIPQVIDKWNKFAAINGLVQIKDISPRSARESSLKARMRDKGFDFDRLLGAIDKSPFLLGLTHKEEKEPFLATFDWILRPSNYTKIMEGNYFGRAPVNRPRAGERTQMSPKEAAEEAEIRKEYDKRTATFMKAKGYKTPDDIPLDEYVTFADFKRSWLEKKRREGKT